MRINLSLFTPEGSKAGTLQTRTYKLFEMVQPAVQAFACNPGTLAPIWDLLNDNFCDGFFGSSLMTFGFIKEIIDG
jgi:hypothetical protein